MSDEHGILIVSSFVKFSNCLIPIVQKISAKNTYCAVSIADAQKILMTHNISSLIINAPLSDGFGLDFAVKCAKEKNYAVLMFVPKELFEQASQKTSPYGILTLQKPNTPDIVEQSVSLLEATAKKISSLTTGASDCSDKIEELKLLTRAKLILISSLGMTEAQAHKFIERRAMEARKTKSAIARSIITSYGN